MKFLNDNKQEKSVWNIGICIGSERLKDKNGRLIYEGDILKIANGSINGHLFPINEPVKWVNNEACFDLPIWGYDSNGNYKDDWSHWFEVVGNIHENPELLEEK